MESNGARFEENVTVFLHFGDFSSVTHQSWERVHLQRIYPHNGSETPYNVGGDFKYFAYQAR